LSLVKEKPLSHKLRTLEGVVKEIIPDICGVLDENNIEYTVNRKQTEVVVQDQSESYITDLIRDASLVDNQVLKLIVDFVGLKDDVYIRLKAK
jgi:hypothetical protein